jgi:flavin reductase (DIM6/NTAB) family NADH-FMN oxidoreductase RutF
LEKAQEFTVSIPVQADLKEAVAFCGSKSGRDYDKFKEAHLTALPAQKIQTPVIEACDLFYECRVVYRQTMEPALVHADIRQSNYANGDYHVFYYGEIVACYRK